MNRSREWMQAAAAEILDQELHRAPLTPEAMAAAIPVARALVASPRPTWPRPGSDEEDLGQVLALAARRLSGRLGVSLRPALQAVVSAAHELQRSVAASCALALGPADHALRVSACSLRAMVIPRLIPIASSEGQASTTSPFVPSVRPAAFGSSQPSAFRTGSLGTAVRPRNGLRSKS